LGLPRIVRIGLTMLEGKKFYKYRAINDHTFDIFVKKQIFAPFPADLNDPFDCGIQLEEATHEEAVEFLVRGGKKKDIPEEVTRSNLKSYLDENGTLKQEHVVDINRAMSIAMKHLKTYGVICFSEKPADILMWSHYTDNHKGVCLEFTAEKGSDLANPIINYKVTYLPEYPRLKITDFLNDDPSIPSKIVMWSKAKIWEYEAEWRLIDKKGGQPVDFPGRLSGIIFGLRCRNKHIKKIVNLTRKFSGIQSMKVHQVPRRFEIEIKPL